MHHNTTPKTLCPSLINCTLNAQDAPIISLKNLVAQHASTFKLPRHLTIQCTITKNAHIELVDDLCCCENISPDAPWETTLIITLEENATVHYHLGALSDKCPKGLTHSSCSIKKNLTFLLIGQHSQAHATCACMGMEQGSYTFNTKQEHCASHTTSSLVIKGALADTANIKNNALIKVHKNCKNVTASQQSRSLLLSPQAHVITIPTIEIESDDVRCRHDAIITKVNKEHLFYLQSRGIPYEIAQQKLVTAFLR
ncbi:MAG: hypothetical protein A2Y40_01735 [Candidatus Margulisbacteria bacterium GWF2_35_9]|nr:MAG: hypothetical protein A2Y40_01735 [Candidatus Margulisbacteria bacterium GWF2_35_9]